MKRTTNFTLLLSVLALVAVANHQLVTPARAANLNPGNKGATCNGDGVWHFVNNQTGGQQTPGTLTVIFSCGTVTNPMPSKINQNVQQWVVTTTGNCTLQDASTNLQGTLVLSNFECAAATPTPTPTPTP